MKKFLALVLAVLIMVPVALAEEYRNFKIQKYDLYQHGGTLHLYGDCLKITGDVLTGNFYQLLLFGDPQEICHDCLMRDMETKTYFTEAELINQISAFVYWTGKNHTFHTNDNCPTFTAEDALIAGTIEQAIVSGNADYCRECYEHDFLGVEWERPF